MSEPIKPNATPTFYNTTIPSLTDDANIQEALRMYHYGTADGSIPDDSGNPIQAESIAAYLGGLQTQIDAFGIGSSYATTEPALTNDDNGFIWVDANSTSLATTFGLPNVAYYQATAPTTGLVEGILWVNSTSGALSYYNGTSWVEVTGGGGSSYTAGAYALTDVTGVDSITSAAGSAFVYSSSPTTTFGVSITTTSGYSKIRVRLSVGYYYANANPVYGPITISRIVNGNVATLTNIGAINIDRSEGSIYFEVVDTHGQSAGSVISYGLGNATNIDTSAVITFTDPFSGAVPMTIQLEAEEIA